MPKSNADAFPAHGNHYEKTAGVQIDFAFNLLTGSIISHSLQAATERDKSIGMEFVIEVRRRNFFCEIWVTSASKNPLNRVVESLVAHPPASDYRCPVSGWTQLGKTPQNLL
jgi:hypothetical protein